MNFRKFYFTVSSVLLLFLFILGLVLLNQISEKNTPGSPNGNTVISDIFEPFIDNKPMNILVLGGDYVNGNTDTIMVVNYNPVTSNISILSLPRDTKVKIDGKNRKINYAYPHGGVELLKSTIRDLVGIDINYFVYVDTSVFRKVIDILGGVDYYVPIDLNYDDPIQDLHIHLKKGQQTLDGAEAEQFMRFRHPNSWKRSPGIMKFYNGSDLNRIDAQQSFIKELVKQKLNIMYIPKFTDVVTTLFQEVNTNFTMERALQLMKRSTDIKTENLRYFKLSGDEAYVGSVSYYVYNGKILDNSTKEDFDAETIINEYFPSAYGSTFSGTIHQPDPSEVKKDTPTQSKPKKKSVQKKNPSNDEGTLKTTIIPEP